ncbi:MAG TPA: hypothetical protein VF941_15510 [Clostridia bacterium]
MVKKMNKENFVTTDFPSIIALSVLGYRTVRCTRISPKRCEMEFDVLQTDAQELLRQVFDINETKYKQLRDTLNAFKTVKQIIYQTK